MALVNGELDKVEHTLGGFREKTVVAVAVQKLKEELLHIYIELEK